MKFPNTPSQHGKNVNRYSPQTAATDNKSSIFKSRALIEDFKGSLDNMIS